MYLRKKSYEKDGEVAELSNFCSLRLGTLHDKNSIYFLFFCFALEPETRFFSCLTPSSFALIISLKISYFLLTTGKFHLKILVPCSIKCYTRDTPGCTLPLG